MIWWPFITKHEFMPEWGVVYQLTQGIRIKYSVVATQQPYYTFEVWIGDKNHYLIKNYLPMTIPGTLQADSQIFHVLSVTRKKNVITMTINGEARKYYLKTPIIWSVKYP